MVSRQPSVHLVASGMRRPSKLKLLVSKYIMSSVRLRKPLSHTAYPPQTEAPPPPPPKDTDMSFSKVDEEYGILRHEYGVYSTLLSRRPEQVTHQSHTYHGRTPQPATRFKFEPPRPLDIATIRKRREESAKQRQREEKLAEQQERERQARIKAEKEHLARELQEQEARRQSMLSEQLRHAAMVRREREEREKLEEENRKRQLEARRVADRERRLRHAQQVQEWMAERKRQEEEEARKRIESRRRIQDERKARPLPIQPSASTNGSEDVGYNGWITIQSSDAVAWRRRYCRLTGGQMALTKDAQTVGKNPTTVPISSIKQIIEQGDDYADLECVPHSFALVFKDGTKLGIFTDNEDQKELLISLLLQLTDL